MDLNHRPSGYEPDELPDCSTPRRFKVYGCCFFKEENISSSRIASVPSCVDVTRCLFDDADARCSTPRSFIMMAEEEGFEPPRGLTRLSVFKTDPFSRTWVFLRNEMVEPSGIEPLTSCVQSRRSPS